MWPWRKRVEVVLASSAVDGTTAALTMILRYHRLQVTIAEVRQAIYEDCTGVPNAAHVVDAAARFRMRGRGLAIDDPRLLSHIPKPNIVHMMPDRGQFPRPLDKLPDGYFAVVASASPRRVRWIDPYVGEVDDEPDDFFALASGVFLVFDEAHALPRATAAR